jgi:hypothetical protein
MRTCLKSEQQLILGFHRALLQSVTFVSRLMHSIIENVDIKIYIVQKFKRHIIKNYSNMFRITKDPSSGSANLYFDWNYLIFNYVSFKLLYNIDFNIYVLYNWVH